MTAARRVNKVLEKDLDARRRSHLAEESVHLRAGQWRGEPVEAVTFVGHARDLHGTVCTCCPQRAVTEVGAA
ncbi:MAG TPA: hypothetical protein VGF17_15460 [Phytomonospora sp.]